MWLLVCKKLVKSFPQNAWHRYHPIIWLSSSCSYVPWQINSWRFRMRKALSTITHTKTYMTPTNRTKNLTTLDNILQINKCIQIYPPFGTLRVKATKELIIRVRWHGQISLYRLWNFLKTQPPPLPNSP